ncbi:hypothetical protein HPB50_024140 [Hyalomma asiaticum]|uniref:Uncharacterized protein n=1 Tax=Hyalomma asiaticum TaxID=266040 RepID=A0ACB7TSM3_HYAAI|nr:hypothetical protein HPB50_024140 [Hyalomma asiaticum]
MKVATTQLAARSVARTFHATMANRDQNRGSGQSHPRGRYARRRRVQRPLKNNGVFFGDIFCCGQDGGHHHLLPRAAARRSALFVSSGCAQCGGAFHETPNEESEQIPQDTRGVPRRRKFRGSPECQRV